MASWLDCAWLGFPQDSEWASAQEPALQMIDFLVLLTSSLPEGWSVLDTFRVSQEGQAALRVMFHDCGTFPLWASVSLSGKGGDNSALILEVKDL